MQTQQATFKDLSGFENLTGLNASTATNDVTVSSIDANAPPIDKSVPANVANSPPIAPSDQPVSETLVSLWCKLFTY